MADYTGVDVSIVRIVWVVLAFFGAAGIVLYVAAWLLLPADESVGPGLEGSVAGDWLARRPDHRNLIVLVIGAVLLVVAVGDLATSGPWWPHWDGGIGFGPSVVALVAALAVVVVAGRNRETPSRVRWVALTVVGVVVATLVVAVATLTATVALSGVPFTGGVGDTQWRPSSPSQVARTYRLGVGSLTVDLGQVDFGPGVTRVTASVGVGRLLVEVPRAMAVSVTAHSGMGDVQVLGRTNGGIDVSGTGSQTPDPLAVPPPADPARPGVPRFGPIGTVSTGTGSIGTVSTGTGTVSIAGSGSGSTASSGRLVIDASVGVGQVQVVRVGP